MINLTERLAALTALQREFLSKRLAALSTLDSEPGRLQLVAYYTLKDSLVAHTDQSGNVNHYLRTRLPEHMRPQAIVELVSFPRLPNGKIDLARLPAPATDLRSDPGAGSGARQSAAAAPDVDSAVNRLSAILGELLGMDDVQADDNFFELGGDSITAIQFVSIAREAGIEIGIAALTQQATLNEIANSQHIPAPKTEVTARSGPTPLTAIQAWFFEQKHPVPERWNQAGRLTLVNPLSADILEHSVRSTVARYPELGQRFYRDADQWMTQIPLDGPPDDLVLRVSAEADSTELSAQIEAIQQLFSLSEGWMFRAAIRLSSTGEAVELVWIAHHLVIDNLSVQSIIREIELTCLGAMGGTSQLTRPAPACPLRSWALEMQRVAEDYSECDKDSAQAMVAVHPLKSAIEADCTTVRRLISHRNPQSFGSANKAYSTQAQELVLAALAIAWRKEMGQFSPVIDVEAHGRDVLGDAVDASQSVGWFTTFFPFRLNALEDPVAVVREVKESFRTTKSAERHFLIKRFLARVISSDRTTKEAVNSSLLLNFSSLVDVGQSGASGGFWVAAPLPAVVLRAPGNIRSHPIEVNIYSDADGLECQWRFSEQQVDALEIDRLHEALGVALASILDRAELQVTPAYSPSDFPDVDIDQDDLDNILSDLGD